MGNHVVTAVTEDSTVRLEVALLVGLAGLVILIMGAAAFTWRLRSNRSVTTRGSMARKERVEYRLTVERVTLETNEYYGQEEEGEDQIVETVEANCYYGQEGDLDVIVKNEYYGE